MPSRYSSTLKCDWFTIHPLGEHTIALVLPPDNYCDMEGAIKVASSVCPTVFRIDTFVGDEKDTVYIKKENGDWKACSPTS